ncbi:hypothetical protein [Candidatus Nitrospira nitrosa]|nr:hypothetical protein [Candidatus Nitrospira nitrosa]
MTAMPYLRDNWEFERGDLSGFSTEGLCRVANTFEAFRGTQVFHPVSGNFFAVLDDPRKVDEDGARVVKPRDPMPAALSHLTFTPDVSGQTTLAVDGAILECPDVTIEAGQALWFHWAFLRFDWSPANDFAMFAAYEKGAAQEPLYKAYLAQSLELERQQRWYTNWEAFSWRPTRRFCGSLRWIVANGISTSIPLPRPGGDARPSALLLDCIALA